MRRQSKLYLLAFSFVVLALFILMLESTNVIPKARAAPVDDHDQNTCTLHSIRGPYAVVGHGTIFTQLPGFPPPPVLFAETGTVTFDGAGNFSGMVTASLNGSIVQPEVSGTYSVNTDCTTSITVSVPTAGLVIHEEGPIIGRGEEFHVIQTDPGWVRTLAARGCELTAGENGQG